MVNSESLGPQFSAQKEYQQFNDSLTRRGGGDSTVNWSTSYKGKSRGVDTFYSAPEELEVNESKGPFTVTVTHPDGTNDEVSSEKHDLAMKMAVHSSIDYNHDELTDLDGAKEKYRQKVLDENKSRIDNFKTTAQKQIERWIPQRKELIKQHNAKFPQFFIDPESAKASDINATFKLDRDKLEIPKVVNDKLRYPKPEHTGTSGEEFNNKLIKMHMLAFEKTNDPSLKHLSNIEHLANIFPELHKVAMGDGKATTVPIDANQNNDSVDVRQLNSVFTGDKKFTDEEFKDVLPNKIDNKLSSQNLEHSGVLSTFKVHDSSGAKTHSGVIHLTYSPSSSTSRRVTAGVRFN